MISIIKLESVFRIKYDTKFTDISYQSTLIDIDNNNLIINRLDQKAIILPYNQIVLPVTNSIEELREELYCWIDDKLKLSVPLLDTHIIFNENCYNLQNYNGELYWRGNKLTVAQSLNNTYWQYYNEFIVSPDLINVIEPIKVMNTINYGPNLVLIQPGTNEIIDNYDLTVIYKQGNINYNSTLYIQHLCIKPNLLKAGDNHLKAHLTDSINGNLVYNFRSNNTSPQGNGILTFKIFYNLQTIN